MSIKDFLLARIAEDEEKGRALQGYTDYFIEEFGDRLLAECAAKRAISEAHTVITVWPEGTGGSKYYTGSKQVCASCDERTETPCPTARALAAVYADHPDYQQEWVANVQP